MHYLEYMIRLLRISKRSDLHPSDQILAIREIECKTKQAGETYTTEESKVQGLAQPASPQLHRHSFCSIVLRRWLCPEGHMTDVEILSHLISLHQAEAFPGCHGLVSRARVPPDAASARETLDLNEAGGVTSNHATSTSSPLCNGSRRPMSASQSDSRGFAALLKSGAGDASKTLRSCGVAGRQ